MHKEEDGRSDSGGSPEDYGFALVTNFPWPAACRMLIDDADRGAESGASQPPARVRYQLEDWVIEYLIVSEAGAPVIATLLIHPGDVDDPDQRRPVPPGGITARLLRRLHPANAQRFARSELAERAEPRDPLADAVALHGYRAADLQAQPGPGRPRRPDRFCAEIAAEYTKALDTGSTKPIEDTAELMHYSPAYVRDVISKARRRGLLTRTGRGRAGGQLTAKGRRTLEGDERSSDRPAPETSRHPPEVWRKIDVHYVPPGRRATGSDRQSELDREIDRELGIE